MPLDPRDPEAYLRCVEHRSVCDNASPSLRSSSLLEYRRRYAMSTSDRYREHGFDVHTALEALMFV